MHSSHRSMRALLIAAMLLAAAAPAISFDRSFFLGTWRGTNATSCCASSIDGRFLTIDSVTISPRAGAGVSAGGYPEYDVIFRIRISGALPSVRTIPTSPLTGDRRGDRRPAVVPQGPVEVRGQYAQLASMHPPTLTTQFYSDNLPDVPYTAQCMFNVAITFNEATKQVAYSLARVTTRRCTSGPFAGITRSTQGVLVR